eukprot:2825263-Rhodomonas_salina.1
MSRVSHVRSRESGLHFRLSPSGFDPGCLHVSPPQSLHSVRLSTFHPSEPPQVRPCVQFATPKGFFSVLVERIAKLEQVAPEADFFKFPGTLVLKRFLESLTVARLLEASSSSSGPSLQLQVTRTAWQGIYRQFQVSSLFPLTARPSQEAPPLLLRRRRRSCVLGLHWQCPLRVPDTIPANPLPLRLDDDSSLLPRPGPQALSLSILRSTRTFPDTSDAAGDGLAGPTVAHIAGERGGSSSPPPLQYSLPPS